VLNAMLISASLEDGCFQSDVQKEGSNDEIDLLHEVYIVYEILFAHALLGCDTISSIFGIGKANALEKVKVGVISQYAKVFGSVATHSEVEKAGEATDKIL